MNALKGHSAAICGYSWAFMDCPQSNCENRLNFFLHQKFLVAHAQEQ
jgi:hypothetical protein